MLCHSIGKDLVSERKPCQCENDSTCCSRSMSPINVDVNSDEAVLERVFGMTQGSERKERAGGGRGGRSLASVVVGVEEIQTRMAGDYMPRPTQNVAQSRELSV